MLSSVVNVALFFLVFISALHLEFLSLLSAPCSRLRRAQPRVKLLPRQESAVLCSPRGLKLRRRRSKLHRRF
ncbi:hypothetical protein YC2023_082852 [Brassica napus]